jgi:hypothetical protein
MTGEVIRMNGCLGVIGRPERAPKAQSHTGLIGVGSRAQRLSGK